MQISRPVRLACLAFSAAASSSFAGFTVTANRGVTTGGFVRWDIVATNSGGATGTQVKALEFQFDSWSDVGPAFEVWDTTDPAGGDPDGIADTVNLLSSTRTRIRVNSTASNNLFVGVSPEAGPVQPNPYAASPRSFSGAVANLGTTQATGAGFQIARIYMPAPARTRSPTFGFNFRGRIGGDKGPAVPFDILDSAGSVVIYPAADVNLDFGPGSGASQHFSESVRVEMGYPFSISDSFSLTAGALPDGVSIDSITGGGVFETGATFTLQGEVSRRLIGQALFIPIRAHRGNYGYQDGYFFIVVTPEPASLATLFALCGARRHRRSDALQG